MLCKGHVITEEDLPPTIRSGLEQNSIKLSIGTSLADAEKEIIRSTLLRNNGNKSKTADILGIGRKTLHRKIQEYNIEESVASGNS